MVCLKVEHTKKHSIKMKLKEKKNEIKRGRISFKNKPDCLCVTEIIHSVKIVEK